MDLSWAFRFILQQLRMPHIWGQGKNKQPALDWEQAKIKLNKVLQGRATYEALRGRLFYSDTEQVYWLEDSSKQEGPFCPLCFREQRITRLTPVTRKGVFFCSIHELTFRTGEYYRDLARNLP